MYKKRTRRTVGEIIHDILLELSKGTHKKTHLMFGVNSSWVALSGYLQKMIDNGYVIETTYITGRQKTERKSYEITDKGRQLLKELIKIHESLGEALEGLT